MIRKTSLALLTALLIVSLVQGVIKSPLELKKVMDESSFIFVGKVEQLYADKPAMVVTWTEDLKGKSPAKRLPVNLKGDKEAEKDKHVPQLLARLGPDLPAVFFVNFNDKTKRYNSFVYTNGTWFQMFGQKTDGDNIVWSLAHGEPYLRRTFRGTTQEMKDTVADVLAKKRKAPAYDGKVEPGFGPEVK